MTKPKPRRPKPVKAWAVFSDGEMLFMDDPHYGGCRQYQIYKTEHEARRTARDVRRVLITPLKKG